MKVIVNKTSLTLTVGKQTKKESRRKTSLRRCLEQNRAGYEIQKIMKKFTDCSRGQ